MNPKHLIHAIKASLSRKPTAQTMLGCEPRMEPAKPKYTDVMVDLETLSQQPTAAILSIGAVAFNPETGELGATFYTVVDLQSCIDAGLTIDGGTFYWWLKQAPAAQEAIMEQTVDVTTLSDDLPQTESNMRRLDQALISFMDFINRKTVGERHVHLWGNGSDFDNAILGNAYRASTLPIPWAFWNNRCYRTLKNQFRDIKLDRSGTHHNALDDAITQAEHAIRLLQHKREIERKAALIDERKAA
ncbi:3'-5' exonuclease [Marinobacterium lutimaris]|uniref:Exodeoxyribonuclease VIII n=1 Tax=Marinobacterium lutimaris TaxID=568106 RepID=A0A1H5XWV3_9GAMM|nr:3'-5' exonuclease [Marinobacterium lutimaris]SEG16123.1 exodeoxyribonuclease VIII [Marinobacterium lutimaris]